MKRIRYMQVGGMLLLLLATLLVGLAVTPARAANHTLQHTAQHLNNATSVNATIYITLATLQPIFENRIAQRVPVSFNDALANTVGKLPKRDQGWAEQMAVTLIQPTATLTGLSTQRNGIATSVHVTLYPGDPQPVDSTLLVSMSVLNSSTIQVTATPFSGNAALVNGPFTTFQIPVGQLNSINTTPGCGDAALGVGLLVPVSLGHATAQGQPVALSAVGSNTMNYAGASQPHFNALPRASTSAAALPANSNSYVEIPASSLASMGNSAGDMPISSSLTAKNIQIAVQGSNLVITSDVYDSLFGKIGTAITTVTPSASNGGLAVHVLSTSIQLFGLFTFPYNSYNQQIENTLNKKLNSALAGKFNVTNAAIGPNAAVPCAAGDSLLLTGSTVASLR